MLCLRFWRSKAVSGMALSCPWFWTRALGDGWKLSGNGFLWGLVNNWYSAEWEYQAEMLRIAKFLWGLKWKKGEIQGRKKEICKFGEESAWKALNQNISTHQNGDPNEVEEEERIPFLRVFAYHLPKPIENGILRRENIFVTKEESKFLITWSGNVVDPETQDVWLCQL